MRGRNTNNFYIRKKGRTNLSITAARFPIMPKFDYDICLVILFRDCVQDGCFDLVEVLLSVGECKILD